jgi:two-component system, NarL family, invasion response regulator UvrY
MHAVNNEQINIAIVDDHNLFRKGLIKLISLVDSERKYVILFEAENGINLQEQLKREPLPHIVLMDINMPDMDGFEAVDWLRRNYPDISILVVSMIESEEAILRMLRMGVKGYLSKDIEVEDMHRALEAISGKGYYYSEFVSGVMAQNLLDNSYENTVKPKKKPDLNQNELEFIRLACTEMTYHQIADKMNLSPKTIDGYRESLFHKFNVKSRVSLAMYAVKNGMVELS